MILAGCIPPETDSDLSLPTADTHTTTDSETGETAEPTGSCGEVGTFDMVIRGRAENVAGGGVAGADLTLVERNWSPGTYGKAVTDSSGRFELKGVALPYAEKCWGTGVQIWLEGETDSLAGDRPLNWDLIKAIAAEAKELEMLAPVILRDRK